MNLGNEDQLFLERKSESQKQSKISYTRDYLLSFSNSDVCKKLPSGFDVSIFSEFDEALITVNERQRGVGGLTFHNTKSSDYGSSPPNRLEGTGSYSRGSSGRWDTRSSGSSSKDGDVQSNHEAFIQDSGRPFGSQSRRFGQHAEQDGLLGSGTYPRSSGYVGSAAPKARTTSHFQLNKASEPYQPPRPYKALPFQRKDDKDSRNDETFGSTNDSSEDRAEEERRRRESFELMRKEQQKALQEKHKQMPDNQKEKIDADILSLLDNAADKKSVVSKNFKVDDSSSLSINDSSRPPATMQAPLSRPLVPPDFSNTASDKDLPVQSSKSYFAMEARIADAVEDLPLDGTGTGQDKRNKPAYCLENNMFENGSVSDILVNDGEKIAIPPSGLQVKLSVDAENISYTTSGLQEVNKVWEEVDISDKNKKKSEVTHSLMQDSPVSILEKLLGGSLSKSSGNPPTSSANQDSKTDEETWVPSISESSKFASWFLEEEKKHLEDNSSNDLLSLIVKNEKVGSPASVVSSNKAVEHMAPNLPFKINDTTEKLNGYPATYLMAGIPERYHKGDKPDSRPDVLTCEDLEQFILSDTRGTSSNLKHTVQGPWPYDGRFEQQKADVDDHASQHLLSLLQKGTKKEMVSVTSTRLDIGLLERFSIIDSDSNINLGIAEMANSGNPETVTGSEKTLTLEALFGSAFMNELQSAQAPVSAQRVADGGINTTVIPTSIELTYPSSDAHFSLPNSSDYQLNKLIRERDMVSLNNAQDANAHYIMDLGKEHKNTPEDLKLHAAGSGERIPEVHLPEEDSLITGRTSSQLPHIANHARPLNPGFDHLTNRNELMKLMGPEGIRHNPPHNSHDNIFPHGNANHVNGSFSATYHLMLQQKPIPGSLPQQLPLQGLPRGVTLSHPINHMQGYIPEMNNVHNISFHHQQPNFGGFGMGMRGHAESLVGGGRDHPEAFQRLIEMELRANAKHAHPAAAGHVPGTYGPELGMSFR